MTDHLAFKGGTCLQKVVFGSAGRFSVVLDFTLDTDRPDDDVLTEIVEVFNCEQYGIAFSDFSKRMLHVKRSEWRGEVTVPKGGRSRRIPMTTRLSAALQARRNLAWSARLVRAGWSSDHQEVIQRLVERVSRRANLAKTGVHITRHGFCSHLAMRGAPVKAIQELAGHRDLSTTQRYMHLSPAAVEGAMRLLEQPATCLSIWRHP